jgi:hypothetical protein
MKKTGVMFIVLALVSMLSASVILSCSTQSKKERKERIAVERYFSEALDGRKYDLVIELFADDGVQYFPGMPPIRGNKNMAAGLNALLGASKSFKTEVKAIVVEGNNVMAYISHEMIYGTSGKFRTQPGVQPEFLNMAGKKVIWSAMAIFIFDDNGKIIEEYINRDDVGIYKQAGTVKVSQ